MVDERKDEEQSPGRASTAETRVSGAETDFARLNADELDEYQLAKVLADVAFDEAEVIVFDEDEDAFVIGADAEAVIALMEEYIDDDEVRDDFAERQRLNTGSRYLYLKLREHTHESPDLSADDIDAAWDESDVGDETVGGTAPTPDQDIVDELGEAVGLEYDDDEPLGILDKMAERERHRWELDPRSARDEDDDLDEDEDPDKRDELDEYNPDDFDDFDDLDDEDDLEDDYSPDDFEDFDDLDDEDDSDV